MMVSVIICTYNPREDYLLRTLDGLRNQSLEKDSWELLIIDNHSASPVSESIDLSWHPRARVLVEVKQGLTPARICSIKEAKGELLIFVDDDNILDPKYLENAVRLFQNSSDLGCFGAACLVPEFEVEPDPALSRFTGYLAVRESAVTKVGRVPLDSSTTPWGAGLCVRASIAKGFVKLIEENERLNGLGRKGEALLSGEDLLFSWVACEKGFQSGIFEELTLIHLIEAKRVTRAYLVKIAAAQAYSITTLQLALHGAETRIPGQGVLSLVKGLFWKYPSKVISGFPFVLARWQARRRAAEDMSFECG